MRNSPASEDRPPVPPADTVTPFLPHDPEQLAVELEQLRDRWLRARADLENYRKRSAQEVERRVAEARERLLREYLEVLDSIDRALQHADGAGAQEGLNAVRSQMEAVLQRYGVQPILAQDARFDPELHEAVSVFHTDDVAEHTVVQVTRGGYTIGNRVLRPAQVIVARQPVHEEGSA